MTQLPPRYEWQTKEQADHGSAPKRAIFASPRTGKSLCSADGLKACGYPTGVIVAPLTVTPQWDRLMTDMGSQTFCGYGVSAKKAREAIAALKRAGKGILILSDSILHAVVEDLLKLPPGALIIDESHRFAGVSTRRGRAMRRLAWKSGWVRLLSGTPVPNHAGNLWGQMVALDKEKWGRSYEKFANRFLIRDAMFPSRVLGTRNEDELQTMLLSDASIVRREDIFGPDTYQVVIREVDLPPEARKLYDRMAKEWVLDEYDLDADNVVVRLMRLAQIAAGFIKLPDGTYSQIHSVKIDACLADLDEIDVSNEKAVVFHRFRPEGAALAHAIRAQYGYDLVINGDTPVQERDHVYDSIERNPRGIAVCQTVAGGIGRSFAEASHGMFLSSDYSFGQYEQAKDRIYKPGEVRVITLYQANRTVDKSIYKAVMNKQDIHEVVRNADRYELVFGEKR